MGCEKNPAKLDWRFRLMFCGFLHPQNWHWPFVFIVRNTADGKEISGLSENRATKKIVMVYIGLITMFLRIKKNNNNLNDHLGS